MNQQLFSRFELFFCDVAIAALSQSRLAQACLRRAYRMMNQSSTAWVGLLMGMTGLVGLFSGCLLYFLMNGR